MVCSHLTVLGLSRPGSSNDDLHVPGAHKDDSISRVASSSTAVTSSPVKTILNFVASTAGFLAGGNSGSTEPRHVSDEEVLEGGKGDKGKRKQVGATAGRMR